ncbi:uncharacterized protein BO95DRAFT_513093 [Aspergillus brunneoviolaceus CBS 621.78]|uniref:Uncharacterized protein n=1 Tax=Aspergillus brunneoviolaceus CBS 621.78 TaxID=1450534 RepID=A0ACD1GDT9_9EURO|nr:hypothetical protein BO95DRAFT_513093 [Aspergillus brunneoviolaceus CBS 621.78]RAH47397.1 hypothetical protein BO95DRAFT_513093 [Aspergillus brunneoviolaceus CBS 621.78]
MAARVSRRLWQLSRRHHGRLPMPKQRSRLLPFARLHPESGAIVGLSNVARPYATHTDFEPPVQRKSSNVDATALRSSGPTQPHWASQDSPIVDRFHEPQFIANFVAFAVDGHLPNGTTTNLPLLQPMEARLLEEPTAAWAPVDTPGPPPSVTCAIGKVLGHCGSHQDPSRLCLVGKNIHLMKARLRDGLVPLSGAQWQEQDLDNPANLERACEHLTAVGVVFEYLRIKQVSTNLRDQFNLISDELGEVQWALNARRRARPDQLAELPDTLDLRALWAEYVCAVYEVMTRTAHAWVVGHLARLTERMVAEFCDTAAVDQTDLLARLTKFERRWRLLADITYLADVGIWMPLEGYKGYRVPTGIVAGLHHPQLRDMEEAYAQRLPEVLEARLHAAPDLEIPLASEMSEISEDEKLSRALAGIRRIRSLETEARDQLRLEMRGSLSPPLTELPPAPWIHRVLRKCVRTISDSLENAGAQTVGFAVYRAACHDISDEEWGLVRAKVEEHVATWGDLEPGAEEVKPLLKLEWFDCRELGIDPKDTEAVRSHFRNLRTQHPLLNQSSFLMLDPWSASSYMQKDQDKLPRDFRPHILAIDADFTPSSVPDERKAKSPGYTGQMRILGNLVWSELYALSVMQPTELIDLWLLAMEHPQKVYTGAVVPSQIQEWREQNVLQDAMIDSYERLLQKKDPKAAQAVREMKEGKYGF